MRLCRAGLLATIVLTVACGSSQPPASSPEAAQGSVTPPTSPPSPSSPNPGSTTSDAGPGAAPPSTEPPISGTGAGDGGSVTPDACAALIVTPEEPHVVEFAWPAVCDGAISSSTGDVALGTHSFLNAPPVAGFGLFTSDATRLGAATPTLPPGPVVDTSFHPAAAGFQGIAAMSTGLQCAAWSRSGNLEVLACPGHPVTSAPTVAGGTVFVVATTVASDPLLVWADANGEVSDGTPMEGSASLVLESWHSSHVVVVDLSGASARARWFDENAKALTGWFTVKARTPAYGASLKLLVDGGVALYDGVAWTALLRDGVEAAEEPPAWLARLSGARLATVRQGRGYAVLRDDLGGVATFELLTTGGESCGSVTLPAGSVRRLDCGYDGTLFAVEARPAAAGIPGGCAFRWWPALLR